MEQRWNIFRRICSRPNYLGVSALYRPNYLCIFLTCGAVTRLYKQTFLNYFYPWSLLNIIICVWTFSKIVDKLLPDMNRKYLLFNTQVSWPAFFFNYHNLCSLQSFTTTCGQQNSRLGITPGLGITLGLGITPGLGITQVWVSPPGPQWSGYHPWCGY